MSGKLKIKKKRKEKFTINRGKLMFLKSIKNCNLMLQKRGFREVFVIIE